jgi:hypothetical protein
MVMFCPLPLAIATFFVLPEARDARSIGFEITVRITNRTH